MLDELCSKQCSVGEEHGVKQHANLTTELLTSAHAVNKQHSKSEAEERFQENFNRSKQMHVHPEMEFLLENLEIKNRTQHSINCI